MLLIYTTEDFLVNNQAITGFPVLINEEGEIFKPVLNFLLFHCVQRGRARSKGSWRKYGQDLYDYFSFIQAQKFNWKDVHRTPSLLASYRDWSIEHFKLQHSTLNGRLTILIKFYQYAFSQQWTAGFPYSIETVKISKQEHFLIHGDRSPDKLTHDVKLKTPRKGVKILTKSQQRQLLEALTNSTHKLWTWLALGTGLRKEELNTFPLKYVVNPQKTKQIYFRVTLNPQEMKTKGDVERYIDVPRSLMLALWDYLSSDRFERIKKHGNDHCHNKFGQSTLFVNRNGKALATDTDTMRIEYQKLQLGFHVNPHMLRHTYATNVLKELSSRGRLSFNPLVYVRDRLGHSSISTTMRYLHFLEYLEDELALKYHEELDQFAAEVEEAERWSKNDWKTAQKEAQKHGG